MLTLEADNWRSLIMVRPARDFLVGDQLWRTAIIACQITDVTLYMLPALLGSLSRDSIVLSRKDVVFCRSAVGCFSGRERSAHISVIRVERETRKNSELAPAQRV